MLPWNDEQNELRATILKAAGKLNENILENDNEGTFAVGKWRHLCALGIPGIPVREEFGGLGKDILTTMYLLEGLGYACEDAGLNFAVSSHIVSTAIPIQKFGSESQKRKYLPGLCEGNIIGAHAITEADSGSDAFHMRTTAVKKDDAYILNGNKMFITNAPIADVFVVYAATDQHKGALGGITAFVVEKDAPGFSVGRPLDKMGLRTSPLSEIIFSDCAVPEDHVVGKRGSGFSIFNYVMKWEILCSFAINVGEMQRQLERCIHYSRTRKQFGKPIAKFQAIAHKIVEMKIRLETSRALLYKAGSMFHAGTDAGIDLALAKIVTSESYIQSSLDAIQIFGAYGYMKEYLIEKDLRNSVAGKIYSGSSEIQKNIVASLLGL